MPFIDLVTQQAYGNAIDLLEVRVKYLDELTEMPFYHKDPFDRLILARSIVESVESIAVLSKDSAFRSYPVTLVVVNDTTG